ncbi:hypothetical protein [Natrinema caseinilyticum]|uniref:hypothetical protein n=1 Tax=Natrinema caseinilyticum TaxID=2961570 RepID=UPI0020C57B79|nr:hypothetical protein [Natrinema caseinilyticum]
MVSRARDRLPLVAAALGRSETVSGGYKSLRRGVRDCPHRPSGEPTGRSVRRTVSVPDRQLPPQATDASDRPSSARVRRLETTKRTRTGTAKRAPVTDSRTLTEIANKGYAEP